MITNNFLSVADFKKAFIETKAIPGPIRKDFTGPITIMGDRQAKFVFSNETIDRDYDLVKQDGIDFAWFKTNPVCFWSHIHDDLPIGKCVSIGIENGCLTGVIEFVPADNPAVGTKAEGIYQLCQTGFLSTVSLGFFPKTVEYPDDDTRMARGGVDILESEMVEISIVGIPSNRSALIQDVSPDHQPTVDPIPESMIEAPKKYRASRLKRILASID